MKSLSLYVDKWFITVAANIDGNVMPLALPNSEDRVWLFFFEDIANSRVLYGKSFENNYRDNKVHYIGDVFSLIETEEHQFTRYANRPEEIREIFKASNIFSHFRTAIQEDGESLIDTYISFSADVSDIARLRFIQELEEAKFRVVESVARISHLALEESRKRGVFAADGMYLTLVATNDNLHYSLYKSIGNLFVRKSEEALPGMGFDVREKALIEYVVTNINQNTHYLSSPQEFASEHKRLQRYAGDWLRLIQNRNPNLPVTIPNVAFAVAPNNPYAVTIKARDLDQRTTNLVDTIVRQIADFVKKNDVRQHEIKGIVFVGNTFTNSKFSAAITSRFIVDNDKLITYLETELPKIVNVYTQIDCSQFKEATDRFVNDAKALAEINRQAREEEKRKEAARAEAQRQQDIKDQKEKAEKGYAEAIENVERYESEHNYEEMQEWAGIALGHRPDDEYAKDKLALAQQLLAEQRANDKQFVSILQRIKTAYSEGSWSDAISQCDLALELRPDSVDVSRIKQDSKRQLNIKEKVINFLNRADMFFAQKLYAEALEEVTKVLNLDSSNTKAKEIKQKITSIKAEHKKKIDSLVSQLNELVAKKDFASAVSVCESLISEDSANIRKWTVKKERLISRQRELEENKRILSQLKEEINQTHFNEDWATLKILCERYLSTAEDQDVTRFLARAKKRIEEQRVKEAKEKALALINGLIVDSKFNEAQAEIDRFAQKYPSEHAVVKDLRRKVFSFDSDRNQPTKPIGFKPDDRIDFFDTTPQSAPANKKITNDDFNF